MASRTLKRKKTTRTPNVTASERWTRLVAWLLCAVTFPLLWLGGLVTTTKSGMAVPDWPGTYGYNLFLYPWKSWLFGPWDLFVEHGHRLLASLAGILTILLTVLVWKYDKRVWLRIVSIVALVSIVAQGILGGLRVVLDERLLAMVHGSTGPLFFALTVAIVVWTSKTWQVKEIANSAASLDRLIPLTLAACLLIYVQMLVGAALRHMPVAASPQTFSAAVKVHLFLAFVVAVATMLVARRSMRGAAPQPVRRSGIVAVALLAIQLALGVMSWIAKYGVPTWAQSLLGAPRTAIISDGWWQTHVVTAHQATGSLLLAAMLTTTLLAWRLAPPRPAASEPAVLPTSATSGAAP